MKRSGTAPKRPRHGDQAQADPAPVCAICLAAGDAPTAPRSYEKHDCEYCEAKLYAGLSDQQVSELRGRLGFCRSGPRQTLFRAGDPTKYLYVVREGQVKLTRTDIDGHEHLLNLVGPGYFLGFDTIGNSSYSYSAETLTSAVFCRIKHDDIVRLLAEAPKVSLNILLAVNEQLAQARDLVRVLGQKSAVEKVAALLLNLYPAPTDGKNSKVQGLYLSRMEMAELLGLTVETVSRIMAELRRKEIIDAPRGRIIIRMRARLQALAGDSPRAARVQKKRSRRAAVPAGRHATA